MTSEPTPHAPFRIDQSAWLLLLVIAVCNAFVFSGVRSAGFIDLDDDIYVTANPHVRSGLSAENAAWALTVGPAGLWMPMTWWSLQLDATLSGTAPQSLNGGPPQLDASVYHLDNLLLHIVGAAALFLFLYRATGGRWASFLVVMLWSIHPLRVESVAWVTERKDVLSGVFGFASLYLYVAWRESGGTARAIAVAAALALSLMAKPTFVTLPLLLLILDYWPLAQFKIRANVGVYARKVAHLFDRHCRSRGGVLCAADESFGAIAGECRDSAPN